MRCSSCRVVSFQVVSLLVLGLFGPAESLAYDILYDYYVSTSHGDPPLVGEGLVTGQPELYGEHTVHGQPGTDNRAVARYFVDLPAGTLGAYTFASGDVADVWPYGFTADARVDQIWFSIRLDFIVPAGEYPAGVDVGISGRADGGLWSEIDSGAQLQYGVTFGAASLQPPLLQIGIDESGSIAIHEPFELVTRIVAPGTVLPLVQVFPVTLTATVANNWTWAVLSGTPPDYHTGAAESDLYAALRFTRVSVPAGVTWVSEDGVFLRDVAAVEEAARLPRALRLGQNAPNPFNPRTTIKYVLPEAGPARLSVFDVAGRLVCTLVDESMPQGTHEAVWDGRDAHGREVGSGSYLARLEFGGQIATMRMGLVR